MENVVKSVGDDDIGIIKSGRDAIGLGGRGLRGPGWMGVERGLVDGLRKG